MNNASRMALERYGPYEQLIKFAEELNEFTSRVLKYATAVHQGKKTDFVHNEMAEEYVDVFKMMKPQFDEIMRNDPVFWRRVNHWSDIKERKLMGELGNDLRVSDKSP